MHVLNEMVIEMRSMLKSVADVNPAFMTTRDLSALLHDLCEVDTQLAELRLRALAVAGGATEEEGFRDVASWVAATTHVRRADAVADVALATALGRGLPVLARALREGCVNVAQAKVIAHAVEELPDRVGEEVRARAEATLVDLAREHDPMSLARLGRRILEVVDPERFEAEEARALAAAERRAEEKQRLRIRALGDGTSRLTAVVPDATAARLATYLHAFTNPRLSDGRARVSMTDSDEADRPPFGERLSRPRRLAEAFTQLLEVLDPNRLPVHGGDATHVMVTIPYEALVAQLGAATIDNETPGDGFDRITAAQARRLACTARLIPAVLGRDSEVLDLGRATRLFTTSQRRALALRDRTCRAEGCSIPGTWSEAHHLQPWAHGGGTDLRNAALLCATHHHRAHDPSFDTTRLADGRFRFRRRSPGVTDLCVGRVAVRSDGLHELR